MSVVFKYALPENCPEILQNTLCEDKNLYRLVSSFPPGEEDFKPRAIMKGMISKSQKMSNIQYCKEYGISVFMNVEDIKTMLKSLQKKKSLYIVCGTLKYPEHGIVKITPPKNKPTSHCDWFPYENVHETEIGWVKII